MRTAKPGARQPWSFEDGPEVARRIEHEYARCLLDALPYLPDDAPCSEDTVEGYRELTATLVSCARTHQSLSARVVTSKATAQRNLMAIRAVWRIVHLYLVACQLRAFETSGCPHDELTLVRLAERRIEELVADVGES